MKKPFFSVIIPTYNQSGLLKKALRSVYNQTYKNYEIIVIDNYSTDNTFQVIKLFNKVIYKKIHNRGIISKSRNLGIKLSKGKWLAFLDSDDYWDKNKLHSVYKKIYKNDFDVACHNEWIINLLGKKEKRKLWSYGPFSENFYQRMLTTGSRNSTSASVVKKSFLKKNKIKFDEQKSFVTSEDYCFFLNIARLNGKFFYMQQPLGYHTFYKESASFNKIKHLKSQMSVIKYHVYKIQKFNRNKNQLYKLIKERIEVKNTIVNLKSNFFEVENINNFFKLFFLKPFLTINFIFFSILKLVKQSILYYCYSLKNLLN